MKQRRGEIMKKVLLASGFIVVTVSVIFSAIFPARAYETAPQAYEAAPQDYEAAPQTYETAPQVAPVDQGQIEKILDATVLITLNAVDPENPSEMIISQGLGTLVKCDGDHLIITHDHWGRSLEHLDVARFWGRNSEMLLKLNTEAFKSLIHYRDGGTMVLMAPQELIPDERGNADSSLVYTVPPPSLDGVQKVEQGDIVLVAVRQPGEGQRVEILEAVVESLDPQFGIPSLTLRRLNGKSIEPGDSGGGVWLDGQLVASLWYRIKDRVRFTDSTGATTETLRLTDLSVAATPPAHEAAEPEHRGGRSGE
jgi:hypothetical protein